MSDHRLDEILDRLRDLDRRLSRVERASHGSPSDDRREHGHHEHGHHEHGHGHGHEHHCGHCGHGRPEHGHPHGDHAHRHRGHGWDGGRDRRGGDFDEKRIIDTIVRLVCENVLPRVQQIVAQELDRRAPQTEAGSEPEAP